MMKKLLLVLMSVLALVGCSDSQFQADINEDEYIETETTAEEQYAEELETLANEIESVSGKLQNMTGEYTIVEERTAYSDGVGTTIIKIPNAEVIITISDINGTVNGVTVSMAYETTDNEYQTYDWDTIDYSISVGALSYEQVYIFFLSDIEYLEEGLQHIEYGETNFYTSDGIEWTFFSAYDRFVIDAYVETY